MKHYTIPFFIIHKGCPHQCLFCDQKGISGHEGEDPKDVADKIDQYISTMPPEGARIEVGFFGGTFTGLPLDVQEKYLGPVQPFIKKGLVQGVRLSTRPDLITKENLVFLKNYGVTCIELGVQSMSDRVLSFAKRGHTAAETEEASLMIVREGFVLGHQIMLGLPLSTRADDYNTARKAVALGAKQVRIYPVLVIKGTQLADVWRSGEYEVLPEEEALKRSAFLLLYFEMSGIKVIRCGLHPSEGLVDGSGYLAGPFHQSFRQKAESRIFGLMLDNIIEGSHENVSCISFNPGDQPYVFGFNSENKLRINNIFNGIEGKLKNDEHVSRGSLKVYNNDGSFIVDRRSVALKVLPEVLMGGVYADIT